MSNSSFKHFFKEELLIVNEKTEELVLTENSIDILDKIRSSGVKLKLVTPTRFGTQIDLFKEKDVPIIVDLLNKTNTEHKVKNLSIFIEN